MTLTVKAEINIDDVSDEVLGELSNEDLIEELKNRGLDTPEIVRLTADDWDLIEAICKNKSLNEADKIRAFFNQ